MADGATGGVGFVDKVRVGLDSLQPLIHMFPCSLAVGLGCQNEVLSLLGGLVGGLNTGDVWRSKKFCDGCDRGIRLERVGAGEYGWCKPSHWDGVHDVQVLFVFGDGGVEVF